MKTTLRRIKSKILPSIAKRARWLGLATALFACAPVGADPLHVLLTNDDGFQAPGIVALHKALLSGGFKVSVAAPRTQQSGSSMRVTLGELLVEKVDEGFWVIDGTPADSVSFALTEILSEQQPDIVISGINFGQNLGSNANLSGTVGAAIMATQHSVPAIAVSAGLDLSESDAKPERFPSTLAAFDSAAQFTVRFVGQLAHSRASGTALLPDNQLLNINVPAIPTSELRGVTLADVARVGGFIPVYLKSEVADQYKSTLNHGDPVDPDVPDADTQKFSEGYITISILDGDLNASTEKRRNLHERVEKFLASPVR